MVVLLPACGQSKRTDEPSEPVVEGACSDIRFADPSVESYVRLDVGVPAGRLDADAVRNVSWVSLDEPSSLEGLECLSGLETLILYDGEVDDLGPLSALPKLRDLQINGTRVWTLAPLATSRSLEKLKLFSSLVADLGPLSNVATLEVLWMSDVEVRSFAPLAGLPALRQLGCGSCPVSDIASLASVPTLEEIALPNAPVADLAPLAALPALEILHIESTEVADVEALSSARNLRELGASHTVLGDLTPLAGCESLEHLDVRGTLVENIEPLTALSTLYQIDLRDTPVRDLTPLLRPPPADATCPPLLVSFDTLDRESGQDLVPELCELGWFTLWYDPGPIEHTCRNECREPPPD